MLLIYRLRKNDLTMRTSSSQRGSCTGAIGELSKWSAAADQDGKQEANSDTIFSGDICEPSTM